MLDANTAETGTLYLQDLVVGMERSLARRIGDREIGLFAEVSSDRNPVHLDEGYASQTMFGGRIAHGMLTASLISAVIGQQLPGHGTVYLRQDLRFLAPVRPGDEVRAVVRVAGSNMPGRASLLNATAAWAIRSCSRVRRWSWRCR